MILNSAHESWTSKSVDLSRLSAAERQAVRLLAEGHTAKSIANAIGTTPSAVNERLREARRKTGVGSSRELARLLKAQESHPERIRMGRPRGFGVPFSPAEAEAWRPPTGVFAMIGLLLLTTAGAAALLAQAQTANKPTSSPQTITDPVLGTFGAEGPAWMYRIIRREPYDVNWAPIAERLLKERYVTVSFGTKPRVLRVICRTSICEVAVSFAADKSARRYGREEASIVEDMRRQGLVQTGGLVTGDRGSRRGLYLAYYLRAKR